LSTSIARYHLKTSSVAHNILDTHCDEPTTGYAMLGVVEVDG